MSRKQKTTDIEQWEEIAEAINELEEAKSKLLTAMAQRGDVPKSVYRDHYDRLNDAESKLKSDLEDRMFEEHGDKVDTKVFYGDN